MAKHGQPSLISYPQRACSGGEFEHQFDLSPQLFSCKYNGWMALIHLPTESIFNRHGEPMSIGDSFRVAMGELVESPFEWLVCEALARRHDLGRGSLFIIDWMTPELSMNERHQLLRSWFSVHNYRTPPRSNSVYLIDQFEGKDEELSELWRDLQSVNEEWNAEFYEGFVATDKNSMYKFQLISPNQKTDKIQKYRFC